MGLITPQGTPEYNGKVNALIGVVRKNPVGELILNSIAKPVSIMPVAYKGLDKDARKEAVDGPMDHCGPSVVPADSDAARIKLKKPSEAGYDDERDQCYTSNPHNRFGKREKCTPTGLGSASTLFFTPGEHGSCAANKKRPGRSDAETSLVYELVHCLRMSQGLIRAVPT